MIRRAIRSKAVMGFGAIVLFWVLLAIFYPALSGGREYTVDAATRLMAPSSAHWFGTDHLGRDVFARVLAGARPVLIIAPLATLLSILCGSCLGLIMGYYRGAVDEILSRIVDAVLAFPFIIIAILILTALRPSVATVVIVISVTFTAPVARVVRAAVRTEREREYVAAAQLLGDRGWYVMIAELLPNVTGPIVVEATGRLGFAVFVAASLAFLGLGAQEPSPDWGLSISQGRAYMSIAPWLVLFPSAALATLVISVQIVADAVRSLGDD